MVELQQPQTRAGKLSDLARHVILPDGIVSTGFPAVRDTCGHLGIFFDGWQDGAGRAILAKRADGLYAADTIAMSIPRQVGKTFLIASIVFAICIITPRTTVIWTAHRFKTARETFMALKAMALRKTMDPHIEHIYSGAGMEQIEFRNGSRIMFGARERGFGRGFSAVDVLMMDEAQILTPTAVEDMVPTTNTAPNPLIFYTGTPPRPDDPSEVFTGIRREALSGESEGTLYIEFSADPDADVKDWDQLAKANPSYPSRTNARAIMRMMKNLTEDSFRREGMGIWDEDANQHRRISPEAWSETERADERAVDGSRDPRFFITISRELAAASIAVAVMGADGPHVELTDYRLGVGWITERVRELKKRYPHAVFGGYQAGPVRSWAPTFEEFRIELQLLNVPETVAGWAHLKRLADNRGFTHAPAEVLTESLDGAVWRELDGGGWVLDWKNSEGDPAPIAAVVGALWLFETNVRILPRIF